MRERSREEPVFHKYIRQLPFLPAKTNEGKASRSRDKEWKMKGVKGREKDETEGHIRRVVQMCEQEENVEMQKNRKVQESRIRIREGKGRVGRRRWY